MGEEIIVHGVIILNLSQIPGLQDQDKLIRIAMQTIELLLN
jgi:hypothetical protein